MEKQAGAFNPRRVCMDFIRGWGHHMHKGKRPEDKEDKSTVAPGTQQGTYGRKQAWRSSRGGSESSPPGAPCRRPVAGTTSGVPRSTAGFSP